jgi:hypothetical protein
MRLLLVDLVVTALAYHDLLAASSYHQFFPPGNFPPLVNLQVAKSPDMMDLCLTYLAADLAGAYPQALKDF